MCNKKRCAGQYMADIINNNISRHVQEECAIWSHSCLIQVFSCWNVCGRLWSIFRLMMCQMFSIGERSGLQSGQFSTRTLLLRRHAVVIVAVCGFALSCWNTQGLPWNRHRLEGSTCCPKTFIYLSACIVPSKTCNLPIPYAPAMLAFELNADNIRVLIV